MNDEPCRERTSEPHYSISCNFDGTFVNAEVVAEGLARAYIFESDERYSEVLVQLGQYAKLREQGLWAGNQTAQ